MFASTSFKGILDSVSVAVAAFEDSVVSTSLVIVYCFSAA